MIHVFAKRKDFEPCGSFIFQERNIFIFNQLQKILTQSSCLYCLQNFMIAHGHNILIAEKELHLSSGEIPFT